MHHTFSLPVFMYYGNNVCLPTPYIYQHRMFTNTVCLPTPYVYQHDMFTNTILGCGTSGPHPSTLSMCSRDTQRRSTPLCSACKRTSSVDQMTTLSRYCCCCCGCGCSLLLLLSMALLLLLLLLSLFVVVVVFPS